jgi:hypothetical protein
LIKTKRQTADVEFQEVYEVNLKVKKFDGIWTRTLKLHHWTKQLRLETWNVP